MPPDYSDRPPNARGLSRLRLFLSLWQMCSFHVLFTTATLPPCAETCSNPNVMFMCFDLSDALVSSRPGRKAVAVARCVAAVLVVFGSAEIALAATDDDVDGPINGANLLQTDVIQGRAWRLSGRLNTLYDSNIIRRVDGEGAVRLSPLVSGGIGMPVGRQQLFFGALYGRDIVFTQERLNRGRNGVGGGVAWRAGSACSGVIGAERFERLSLMTEQAELVDNVQTAVTVAGSIGCQTPTGIGFGGSVEHRTLINSLDSRSPFDLRSTVYAPNISYGTPTLGQFSLTASFNSTTYPNRSIATSNGIVDDGIRIMSGRIGYQRNFGTRLQLGLGASYLKTTPQPDNQLAVVDNQVVTVPRDDFSGSGYDATISYQPSSRLTVGLQASRNVRVSPNVGALFIVRSDFGADLAYRMNPAMSLGAGARLTKSNYKESFSTDGEAARISDNTKRFYANFNYSPVKLYTVSLQVAHQLRRSDPEEFNFDSTSVRLTLVVNLGRG